MGVNCTAGCGFPVWKSSWNSFSASWSFSTVLFSALIRNEDAVFSGCPEGTLSGCPSSSPEDEYALRPSHEEALRAQF